MNIKRAKNDINGNGRYIVHFLPLLTDNERSENVGKIQFMYDLALNRAKKYGGKKYRGKDFGGGIVFQHCGSEGQFIDFINQIVKEASRYRNEE